MTIFIPHMCRLIEMTGNVPWMFSPALKLVFSHQTSIKSFVFIQTHYFYCSLHERTKEISHYLGVFPSELDSERWHGVSPYHVSDQGYVEYLLHSLDMIKQTYLCTGYKLQLLLPIELQFVHLVVCSLYRIPADCGACTYVRNRGIGACTKSESKMHFFSTSKKSGCFVYKCMHL